MKLQLNVIAQKDFVFRRPKVLFFIRSMDDARSLIVLCDVLEHKCEQ